MLRKRKHKETEGWHEGDHAIVTGDTERVGHQFPPRTEVRLISYDRGDSTWKAEYLDHSDFWWVSEDDLEPVVKPPTEKELRAALKSIQQSARRAR